MPTNFLDEKHRTCVDSLGTRGRAAFFVGRVGRARSFQYAAAHALRASIALTLAGALGAWGSPIEDLRQARASVAEPSPCEPITSRFVSPARIALGSTTIVTATVALQCHAAPIPLDVVIVLDRSPSMKGTPLDAALVAAGAFVARTDLARTRIGIVSFSDEGDVEAELSHNERYLRSAIAGIRTPIRGGTDVAAGLRAAGSILQGERSRPDAASVIVLLSDARNGLGELPVIQQARILRDSGVYMVTIALGISAHVELMASIASTPDDAYSSAGSSVLTAIFERIAGGLMSVGAHDIVVLDRLEERVAHIAGSSRPPGRFDGRSVEWRLSVLGAEPRSLALELRPNRIGLIPTSVGAEITWTDSLGRTGVAPITIPVVDVFDPSVEPTPLPSATPTSSATATNPPTPSPESATPTSLPPDKFFTYIPWASSAACEPVRQQPNVVLVIDASTTMELSLSDGRSRIAAARAAAQVFAERTVDQGGVVGVVAFDAESRVLVAPTRDRTLIRNGLDAIVTRVGSRFDLGLTSARVALEGMPAGAAGSVMVALTDGRVVGSTAEDVESAASLVRGAGIELWSIPLGADAAGLALLKLITIEPSRVIGGTGETDLEGAFDSIFAGAVCR